MLTTVEGVYENGVVRLLEPLPGVAKARVVVTVLPDPQTPLPERETLSGPPAATTMAAPVEPPAADALIEHYQPRTELGRKLIELRQAYLASGGKLMTQDEILADVRQRRGEDDDD
jgi:hypothetical protein